MLTQVIAKQGSNLLKVGVVVLLSTMANVALKEQTNAALKDFAQDYRRLKTEWKDRHQIDGEPN